MVPQIPVKLILQLKECFSLDLELLDSRFAYLQEKYRDLATVQDQEWLVKEIFQPTPSPESVLEKFPSHGHIDLLPQVQGQGWGRKMMEAMENRLSELGSPGFHLRVSAYNDRGLKFYSAIGYSELMRRGDEVIVGKELK